MSGIEEDGDRLPEFARLWDVRQDRPAGWCLRFLFDNWGIDFGT